MDKNQVKFAALRLPIESRRWIVAAIQESIERDLSAPTAEDRLAQLLPVACEALGVTDYNPKRKANGDAYVRNLIAYGMRREGYTFAQIARAMGRHTSSAIVMARRGKEMRDGYFGTLFKEMFKKFELPLYGTSNND